MERATRERSSPLHETMTGPFRRWGVAALSLALSSLPTTLAAQFADDGGAAHSRPVPTAVAEPRDGAIDIDGHLDEAAWREAPVATGFIEQQPDEGEPAHFQTRVRVLFDDDAIYVGARMADSAPGTIARQMVRRDQDGQFDYFAVEFDPDRDRRTGYRFRVSASNVQRDEYLYDDSQHDDAWNAVWESAVSIDSSGWSVEMRIPLSQIRFPASAAPETWGVNFYRKRLRNNEESQFALISRLQHGHVSQFGALDGIRIANAGRRMELRPYVLTSATQATVDPANPFSSGRDVQGRVGGDVRYGLGGQFSLDATLNPDFGQVEADPAVINLTAFETFFDERRPFFVEDAKIFDFSLSGFNNRVFYSRRIGRKPHGGAPDSATYSDVPDAVNILGAAKLTGRTRGGLSVGALAALTQDAKGSAYYADRNATEHFLVEPRTGYGVVRLQQAFNDGASTIGAIGTLLRRDLPPDGAFSDLPRTAIGTGIDWEHQWQDRTWAFYGYLAASRVAGDSLAMIRIQRSSNHYFQRPDAQRLHVDSSATSMTGYDWRMTLDKRRGEHWTGSVWAAEVSPGFEINDLGYSNRQEVLDGGFRIQYREIRPGRIFRTYNGSLSSSHNYSHDLLGDVWSASSWSRNHVSGNVSFRGMATLLNYWRLNANLSWNPERMDRTATRGGPLMLKPASWSARLGFDSDSRRAVTIGPNLQLDRSARGAGWKTQIGVDVGLHPSSRVAIRLQPKWSRSRTGAQYVTSTDTLPFAPTFGRRYLFGDLDRQEFSLETRLSAAFSPTLSLQLYVQPLLSSGNYLDYKQFLAPETYTFDVLSRGTWQADGGSGTCTGGRTCLDPDGTRLVDFNGDGTVDYSFGERSFTVRSLLGNAVLRWEYRPGSTLFLVWQRRQSDRTTDGTFDFQRDVNALWRAPAHNVFLIKARYWIGF